jgi:hypothetical protein
MPLQLRTRKRGREESTAQQQQLQEQQQLEQQQQQQQSADAEQQFFDAPRPRGMDNDFLLAQLSDSGCEGLIDLFLGNGGGVNFADPEQQQMQMQALSMSGLSSYNTRFDFAGAKLDIPADGTGSSPLPSPRSYRSECDGEADSGDEGEGAHNSSTLKQEQRHDYEPEGSSSSGGAASSGGASSAASTAASYAASADTDSSSTAQCARKAYLSVDEKAEARYASNLFNYNHFFNAAFVP